MAGMAWERKGREEEGREGKGGEGKIPAVSTRMDELKSHHCCAPLNGYKLGTNTSTSTAAYLERPLCVHLRDTNKQGHRFNTRAHRGAFVLTVDTRCGCYIYLRSTLLGALRPFVPLPKPGCSFVHTTGEGVYLSTSALPVGRGRAGTAREAPFPFLVGS